MCWTVTVDLTWLLPILSLQNLWGFAHSEFRWQQACDTVSLSKVSGTQARGEAYGGETLNVLLPPANSASFPEQHINWKNSWVFFSAGQLVSKWQGREEWLVGSWQISSYKKPLWGLPSVPILPHLTDVSEPPTLSGLQEAQVRGRHPGDQRLGQSCREAAGCGPMPTLWG
jgi:hypothetical protein